MLPGGATAISPRNIAVQRKRDAPPAPESRLKSDTAPDNSEWHSSNLGKQPYLLDMLLLQHVHDIDNFFVTHVLVRGNHHRLLGILFQGHLQPTGQLLARDRRLLPASG